MRHCRRWRAALLDCCGLLWRCVATETQLSRMCWHVGMPALGRAPLTPVFWLLLSVVKESLWTEMNKDWIEKQAAKAAAAAQEGDQVRRSVFSRRNHLPHARGLFSAIPANIRLRVYHCSL